MQFPTHAWRKHIFQRYLSRGRSSSRCVYLSHRRGHYLSFYQQEDDRYARTPILSVAVIFECKTDREYIHFASLWTTTKRDDEMKVCIQYGKSKRLNYRNRRFILFVGNENDYLIQYLFELQTANMANFPFSNDKLKDNFNSRKT